MNGSNESPRRVIKQHKRVSSLVASRNNVSNLLSPINEKEDGEAFEKDHPAGKVGAIDEKLPNDNDSDYYMEVVHNKKYDHDTSTMRQSLNLKEESTGAAGTGAIHSG